MSDLVTRIAAEDAQFRAGMARVDARLNQTAVAAKRAFSGVSSALRGFGALGVVTTLTQLHDQIMELVHATEALGTAGDREFDRYINASKRAIRVMRGEDLRKEDIQNRFTEEQMRLTAARDQAKNELRKEGFLGDAYRKMFNLTISDTMSRDEQMNELDKGWSSRVERARAQRDEELAALQRVQRDERKKAFGEALEKVHQAERKQAAERLSIAEELRDRQVEIAKESGNAVLAEQLRLEEEYRKSMKRISEAEGISYKDRSMFGEAARQIRDSQMQAFLARRSQEIQDRLPGGIANLAAGSSGSQQLTALMRDTANANREMSQDVRDILGKLGTIVDRIESPSYSVYAN